MVVLNHTAKYDIAWLAQLGTRVFDDIHFVRQQEVFEPIPVAGLARHDLVKAKGLIGNQIDQTALHL